MRRHLGRLGLITMATAILALAVAAPAYAGVRAQAQEEEEETGEFSVANIFFELNHTDGDLGIHALIDGDPWKQLVIEVPGEREELQISLRGNMRRQGLTELFFESAEPTFDELSPESFFRRFPEGEYEVEGLTIDGEELDSTAIVTHLLPAPPENFAINGMALPESCDDGPVPSVSEPFTLSWDPVTLSHPDLGRTGEPIDVVLYQLVLEREEPEVLKFTIDLHPGVTSVQLPVGLTSPGEEIKAEVLVREASGNQTALETCFEVD